MPAQPHKHYILDGSMLATGAQEISPDRLLFLVAVNADVIGHVSGKSEKLLRV